MTETPINRVQIIQHLLQDVAYKGQRVKEALEAMETNIQRVRQALDTGYDPMGGWTVKDDPERLLNDMRSQCQLLIKLGLPEEAIAQTRRGEMVWPQHWGEELRAEVEAHYNLNRKEA